MKIKQLKFAAILAISVFTACTVNVNQPNTNQNVNTNVNKTVTPNPTPNQAIASNETPWSVVVCSSRAKNVTLSAGPNENDNEVFATWKESSNQKKFELPARVQKLSSIFFMGSASDKNQVELCVLFDGKPKKRIEFDDSEDHIINSNDADDSDCRCTE